MTHVSIDSVDMEFPPGRLPRMQHNEYDFTRYVTQGVLISCVPPAAFDTDGILRACAPAIRKVVSAIPRDDWRVCDIAIVGNHTLSGYVYGTMWYDHCGAHVRCADCAQAYMVHLKDGRCLYEASFFRLRAGILYRFNTEYQTWEPEYEVPR